MGPASIGSRRKLAIVGLLAVVVAAGGCASSGDGSEGDGPVIGSDATTKSGAGSATTSGAGSATTSVTTSATTSAGDGGGSAGEPGGLKIPPGASVATSTSSPFTSVEPPAATTNTPPGPGSAQAIAPGAPGRYDYATTGELQSALGATPLPASSTLVVDPPTGSRQRARRTVGDGVGPTLTTETVFEYRPEGVFLVSLSQGVSFLLVDNRVLIEPATPELLIPTGARAGYRSELTVPTDEGEAVLAVEVLGAETVTVAGQAVGAVVVSIVTTLPDATADLSVWLSPRHGLYVKERSVMSSGSARIASESILENLSPR